MVEFHCKWPVTVILLKLQDCDISTNGIERFVYGVVVNVIVLRA